MEKRDKKQAATKHKTQLALTFFAHKHFEFSCGDVSLYCVCVCVCAGAQTRLSFSFSLYPSLFLHWRQAVIWFHVCSDRSSSINKKKYALLRAFFSIHLRYILTWKQDSFGKWFEPSVTSKYVQNLFLHSLPSQFAPINTHTHTYTQKKRFYATEQCLDATRKFAFSFWDSQSCSRRKYAVFFHLQM